MSHGARPEKMKLALTGEGAGPTPVNSSRQSNLRLHMMGDALRAFHTKSGVPELEKMRRPGLRRNRMFFCKQAVLGYFTAVRGV